MKKVYEFDQVISRKNTASYKWDQLTALFGSEEVLPLWVADMDFPCAEPIVQATINRAKEGIYGYSFRADDWNRAMVGWYERRHLWQVNPESVLTSPSVVTSLSLAVELFSAPGAGVVLQSPVYYPFYEVIRMNGRHVVANSLLNIDGQYRMNLEALETQFRQGNIQLMLLCNPHNPGGRVWTYDELRQLAALCAEYNVTVVSDEIHCDLVFAPHRHTPFAAAVQGIDCAYLTLVSATKTFNIPGVQSSFIIVDDASMRGKLSHRMRALSLHMHNFFAHSATIAAYNEGDDWLDQLLPYLKANIDYAIGYLREVAPLLQPMVPEGTYLLWVDARALGLNAAQMKHFMYADALVAFNEGSSFGSEGEGYVRINCACPRSILQQALERFAQAIQRKDG
jgi:cystathionine beta-lyase